MRPAARTIQRALVAVASLCGGTFPGCDTAPPAASESAWRVLDDRELAGVHAAAKGRAEAARVAMSARLSERLRMSQADGGPEGAVGVCKEEAPEIARAVSLEHGVRIGRTSFALRNSRNPPPDWAEPLVERRVEVPTYLGGRQGEFAALLPIRLEARCLACHGGERDVSAAVRTVLAREYPDDQATGFAEGDLRGWFWVVVPGSSSR